MFRGEFFGCKGLKQKYPWNSNALDGPETPFWKFKFWLRGARSGKSREGPVVIL